MPTLEEVKTYLRIDGSEDDSVFTLLIGAAKKDLKDSGVPEPTEKDERYDLAVMLFVLSILKIGIQVLKLKSLI